MDDQQRPLAALAPYDLGDPLLPSEPLYGIVATLLEPAWRALINAHPAGSIEVHWHPKDESLTIKVSASIKRTVRPRPEWSAWLRAVIRRS